MKDLELAAAALKAAQNAITSEIADSGITPAERLLALVNEGDGVIILTDIFGATPSNLALKLLEPGRVEGLTGVNLPMLLRALNYRDKGMTTLLVRARDGGRDGILNMLDH